MKNLGLKISKYKVYILDNMDNSIECHNLKNESEIDTMIYSINDNTLFKAYIGGGLYCQHKKLS